MAFYNAPSKQIAYKPLAFLLSNPGGNLMGTTSDVENMFYFLTSPYGGAFRQEEIVHTSNVAEKPLLTTLDTYIQRRERFDYIIFYFSGHGQTNSSTRDLQICVGNGSKQNSYALLPISQIHSRISQLTSKSLYIFDCCRTLVDSRPPLLGDRFLVESQMPLTKDQGRQMFAEYLRKQESDCTALYSCSMNQSSGDNANGGLYTQKLIDHAWNWAQAGQTGQILTAQDTYSQSMSFVSQGQKYTQTPSKSGKLRLPFAIK